MPIHADTILLEAARRIVQVIREHAEEAEWERRDATWIATTAVVMAGDPPRAAGAPEVVMAYLPRDSCQVIDTWHVLGMRGTGSHDVAVTDVFVPTARTFPLVPAFTPGSHYHGPLYRFPLVGMVASNLPPLLLAVARRAIEEVSALAQAKVPVAASTTLRERASAQAKLPQAEALVHAGRVFLYETLRETWEATVAGEPLSLRHKADVLLAMTYAVQSAGHRGLPRSGDPSASRRCRRRAVTSR
jgi:alkylation response protein AidB-like acyl-CoA dehydrogenase